MGIEEDDVYGGAESLPDLKERSLIEPSPFIANFLRGRPIEKLPACEPPRSLPLEYSALSGLSDLTVRKALLARLVNRKGACGMVLLERGGEGGRMSTGGSHRLKSREKLLFLVTLWADDGRDISTCTNCLTLLPCR